MKWTREKPPKTEAIKELDEVIMSFRITVGDYYPLRNIVKAYLKARPYLVGEEGGKT